MRSTSTWPAGKADAIADLEAMLVPLGALDELTGLGDAAERFAAEGAQALPVELSLELDPRAPHLSFAEQLVRLVARVATARGVACSPALCAEIDRLAAHARCVAEAWAEVRRARRELNPFHRGDAP
jgi:hypothetical protein